MRRVNEIVPSERSEPNPPSRCNVQYILDKMGTHFDTNCKHFCSDSHFIEFPFYREKIATLFNFFRSPFREKSTFWSRNPYCLTSFFSKSSHFRGSLAICQQNLHFIENPFYREKIATYFGGISRKIPISSNSHFIENVLYFLSIIILS